MANNRQEKDQNNTRDRGPGKPGSLSPQQPAFDAQEEVEGIEAVPFSLDEVALMGGPAAGAQKGPTGQFSGDDLEFESFMFDQGDKQQSAQGNATAPPAPAPIAATVPASNAAPAAPAAPAVPPGLPRISGDTVSTPFLPPLPSDGAPGAQVGASPMQAQSPAQSGPLPRDGAAPPIPPASSLDAARTLDPNTGNLAGTGGQPSTPLSGPLNRWLTSGPLSEQAVPAPASPSPSPSPSTPAQPMPTSPNLAKTQLSGPLSQRLASSPLTPQMVQPASYPTSVAGWNDELLASVKDFSAVLLALRTDAAQTQAATHIPVAPVVPAMHPPGEAAATDVTAAPPLSPGLPGPVQTGQPESARGLPHLIGDASSGHTGWTSVQLNDEALASQDTAEEGGPQAGLTPEQGAGDQPESAAALEGNVHEGGEGLSWLGSLTSSGPLLTSSGPLRSDQVSAAPPSEEPVMEAAAQAERTEMEAPTPVPAPVAEQPEAQAAAPASETLERGEQPDSGLPPWLMEEREDTDMAASRASLPSQAAEPEVSSLVGLGTTDTAGTQTLTPTGEATGQGMPLLGAQAGMDAAATGATSSTFADLPDLPEGGLSGDDLEFENFMFDEGKSVPLPSLPNIGEFMSSVQSMEATIGPASPDLSSESWVPGQAKLDSEPSVAPAMEPAFEAEDEDEDEPLPFWLQDADAENVEAAPPDSLMPTSGYLEVAPEPAPEEFVLNSDYDAPEPYFTGAGEFAQFAQVESEPGPAFTQVEEYESPGADLGYAASEQGGDFTELPPIEPFDFETELPPIEPFDFSMVQPPPQEDSLGFNTEELTGAQLSAYEPMMVTANLDELAKLLGKDPANLRGQESEAAKLLLGQILETPHKQAEPVATPGEQAPLRSEGGEQRSAAWTVMETSKLPMDAVNDLTGTISEAAMPTEQDLSRGYTSTPTPMSSTEELTMADLDVAPFDITELNLDADELGTGLLHLDQVESGLLRSDADFPPGTIPEAPYARPHERVFTNTLFSKPGGQPQSSAPADPPNRWEAPKWMGNDRPSPASDRGSGLLADRSPSLEPRPGGDPVSPERSQTRDLETTRFASSSAPLHTEPEPASVDDPDNIFKVRVSKFKSVRSGPLGGLEAGGVAPPQGSPQSPAPGPASPVPASQPVTRGPAPLATQDTQSGPISATGPLPAVQGFEHLESMAKEKPDDLGSRMALAVAYAQAGYMEHAMHEYGRLLKNRHVPAPMLQLVSDLLSDVEDEATGSVRFHQTRGDLYMKQGRHQEAIVEYNKIK